MQRLAGGDAEQTRIDGSWVGLILIVGMGAFKRHPVGTVVMVSRMGLIVGIGSFKRLPVGTVVRRTFG